MVEFLFVWNAASIVLNVKIRQKTMKSLNPFFVELSHNTTRYTEM